MKELVFVEFLFPIADYNESYEILLSLGSDFQNLKSMWEYEEESDVRDEFYRVSGKISSMAASIIKLKYPKIAQSMRISYISDELKDKYRT